MDRCQNGVYCLEDFTLYLGLHRGEQQDPQEFAKLFLGRLESLKLEVNDRDLKSLASLYSGREAYVTKCQKCNHESCSEFAFNEIKLNIGADVRSLENGLRNYFTEEILEGENQYFCSKCEKLQNAIRSTKINERPTVLLVNLLRYVYNRNTGTKTKLKVSTYAAH